jgi:biopolymer transport protein ExbB
MVTLLANLTPLLAAEATADVAKAMGRQIPAWAKGNFIFEKFFQGGPVMWPILIVAIVAVAVILERTVWWIIEATRRNPQLLDKIYASIEQGDVEEASKLGRGSKDPLVRTVWHGVNHVHSSVEGALQVASGVEIQRAGRFMAVMDTAITLGPLLGLLGTVTGIMSAFEAVNSGGLNPQAVSGGIGEALIATACGLGIAIFTLLFFNFYNAKLARLMFELETTANNVILMTNTLRLKNNNLGLEDAHRQSQQFASTN